MNPDLLLLIFLPTIGFSAAIAQEPHMLRRNWGQVRAVSVSAMHACRCIRACRQRGGEQLQMLQREH